MATGITDGRDHVTRLLALTGIVANLFFVFTAIAVHIIDRRYNPIRDYMSDYVVGPAGWLFTIGIFAAALGGFALSAGLWRVLRPPARPVAGIALIALFAAGYALLGLFPTDILAPGELPTTMSGTLHIIGALIGWVSFPLGSFLTSRQFRHYPILAGSGRTALTLSYLAIATFTIFLVVEALGLPVVGLLEKTFIAFRELWLLLVGFALLRIAR